MTLTWGPWQADPSADPTNPATHATPYGHWYETFEHQVAPSAGGFASCSQAGAAAAFPGFPLPRLTLPIRALPHCAAGINPPGPRADVTTGLTARLNRKSVITGVIDAGVALSHDRFRRPGGGTRILSAWAQGGKWAGQTHLPFGCELMQGQIDGHMAACTSALGVDEAAFNRRAGLVDYADPFSERWIDTDAPHGTHVADLAAGFDPAAIGTLRDRLPMIVVELAPRVAIGPSGSYLEFYVMWAIRHIALTADAIWDALFARGDKAGQGGFPIVINLSYGLLAGPKDGTMAVQKYMAGLNAARPGRPPLVVMLPAGNDNLERGVATLTVAPETRARRIGWRISPEDHTSNYAEVWTGAMCGSPVAGALHPCAISLSPPGGPAGPGTAGAEGQFCDLSWSAGGLSEVVARIYCRQTHDAVPPATPAQATYHRLHYVICAAPSFRGGERAAPSGVWTIALSTTGPALDALLYVQSDQDLTPGHGLGRMSYFDDPLYATHDALGRLNDTYFRDPVTGAVTTNFSTGPVKRRDTLNAIAAGGGTLTIAGYRRSDGLPADYSSAGRDGADPQQPGYACVSDDGIWRNGRMAAGGRSGSTAVLQGTSFATGEATRIVARDFLRQMDNGVTGTALQVAGAGFVANVPDPWPVPPYPMPASAMPLKLGSERLPMQDHGRLPR